MTGFTELQFRKSIIRYIKNNLTEILLNFQKKQLFENSEGADSVKLGTYSPNSRKAPGQPFDMVDTGLLKRSLRIEVSIERAEVVFVMDSKYRDRVRFQQPFKTSHWMGLTNEHKNILLEQYLQAVIRRVVLNKILTGKWS